MSASSSFSQSVTLRETTSECEIQVTTVPNGNDATYARDMPTQVISLPTVEGFTDGTQTEQPSSRVFTRSATSVTAEDTTLRSSGTDITDEQTNSTSLYGSLGPPDNLTAKCTDLDAKEITVELCAESADGDSVLKINGERFPVHEILSVRSAACDTREPPVALSHGLPIWSKTNKSLEPYRPINSDWPPLTAACGLFVYVLQRQMKHHEWRVRAVFIEFVDPDDRLLWETQLIFRIHRECSNRPRSLLTFVNPYGGKKTAPQVYETSARPIFELAGIHCTWMTSSHRGHVRDLLSDEHRPLDVFDGLIVVGGDGFLHELANAILMREQKTHKVHVNDASVSLRTPAPIVGMIAGGSSNAFPCTVNGTACPITAALHIAVGDRLSVDVASLHRDHDLMCFAVLFASYGMVAYGLALSERMRALGPKRYEVAALRTFLKRPIYSGLVHWQPCPTDQRSSFGAHVKPRKNSLSLLRNRAARPTVCGADCQVCTDSPDHANAIVSFDENRPPYRQSQRLRFANLFACVNACVSAINPRGLDPSAHLGDGTMTLLVVPELSRAQLLRFAFSQRLGVPGEYVCLSLATERVKRLAFTSNPQDEFSQRDHDFNRGCEPEGMWNIDGELVEDVPDGSTVHMRVHAKLLRVFARGPELPKS